MCFVCEAGVTPLTGFDLGFNCTFLVPSAPSVSVQNAAYDSAVAETAMGVDGLKPVEGV